MLSALLLAALASGAWAQAYPSRPIRLLVGNPAGGPADTIARVLADAMSPGLSEPIVVENRPGGGAGGALAMSGVANAPPDGYLIGLGTSGPLGTGAVLNRLPYDVLKSFTPITLVSEGLFFLIASPELGANNVAELVKVLAAHPGKYNYGSDGIGSTPHLGFELFKLKAGGLFVVHIPYNGSDQKIRSFLAGDTQLMMIPPGPAIDRYVKDGKMRAMAVIYGHRLPEYPNVPTLEESGIKGVNLTSWFCLVGPAGLNAEVVARLNREAAQALAKPQVQSRIMASGQTVVRASSPEELAAYMANANRQWKDVVARANIKVED
jgi:tripartite-type tricarboxylate transporter receptor subunit TctC